MNEGIADCQLPMVKKQSDNSETNWQLAIGNEVMETLFKDIRYGLRGLLKRKGFAAIAVLTLSLGIGANTAIFTLVNAVMLKSLPVDKPEELVLFSDATGEGTSVEDTPHTGEWNLFSYASYEYFRAHNQSFQDIAALRSGASRLSVRQTDSQAAA